MVSSFPRSEVSRPDVVQMLWSVIHCGLIAFFGDCLTHGGLLYYLLWCNLKEARGG
jgi:hypothetical protein